MSDTQDGLEATFLEVVDPIRAQVRDLYLMVACCATLALGCAIAAAAGHFSGELNTVLLGGIAPLLGFAATKFSEVPPHRREMASARATWALARGEPSGERKRVLQALIEARRNGK